MNLFADIQSRRWLIVKGILFLVLSLSASAVLLYENWSLQNLALLVIAIWAACRFYYFLFHVLENTRVGNSAMRECGMRWSIC